MTDDGQPEVRWLDQREMTAWRAFVETVHDLLRSFEIDLSLDGLTLGDYQVLVYLAEASGPMRMSELALRLQLTPSGLTRRLDGLVRSGDVERVRDSTDGRVMQAHLTNDGRQRLRSAAPRHMESVRTHFLGPIDPSDLDAVGRAFLAVRAHLNGDEDADRSAVPERHGPTRHASAPSRRTGSGPASAQVV